MSVPKKRTSYSKKKIRKQRWFNKILKFTNLFYSQKSLRQQVIKKSAEKTKERENT